jgi:hypothetical protein
LSFIIFLIRFRRTSSSDEEEDFRFEDEEDFLEEEVEGDFRFEDDEDFRLEEEEEGGGDFFVDALDEGDFFEKVV